MANDLDKHLLATLLAWFATDWAFDQVVFVVSRQDSRQATLLSDVVK